jgi:hypothetical protein
LETLSFKGALHSLLQSDDDVTVAIKDRLRPQSGDVERKSSIRSIDIG